jgi:hypothetical protein
MSRMLKFTLLLAVLAPLGLSACGKKAEPLPPAGTDSIYPRKYPTQ